MSEHTTLGRQALVHNLVQHLRQGNWALVNGGPGMGKTTLLWQVVEQLRKHTDPQDTELLFPAYFDLSRWKDDSPANLGQIIISSLPSAQDSKPKTIALLLDNCEVLLPDPLPFIKQVQELALDHVKLMVKVMVLAGDMEWGAWSLQAKEKLHHPVRIYPLGVMIPREVRGLLSHSLGSRARSETIEHLLLQSGGHPFILQTLLGQLILIQEINSDQPNQSTLKYLHPFFQALWKTLETQEENRIVQQLVQQQDWIPLEELERLVNIRHSKAVLDRLCACGLIIRTIVDGGAAIRIVSPLIGQWINANF